MALNMGLPETWIRSHTVLVNFTALGQDSPQTHPSALHNAPYLHSLYRILPRHFHPPLTMLDTCIHFTAFSPDTSIRPSQCSLSTFTLPSKLHNFGIQSVAKLFTEKKSKVSSASRRFKSILLFRGLLVFTVFCYCFVYVYLFLFVLSVLV